MKTSPDQTIIQCDFDGTITEEDQAFLLLDAFANGNWRRLLDDYREGRISVGGFNARAFAMVKADRQTLVDFIRRHGKVRPGFANLVSCCRDKGYRLVIVSNGLDFYIDEILRCLGANGIEFYAAKTRFDPRGLEVKYVGPDGRELDDSFKETYTRSFLSQKYRVIYLGNGPSDMPPARLAHRVFAIDDLLRLCREKNIDCLPFTNLNDVVKNL